MLEINDNEREFRVSTETFTFSLICNVKDYYFFFFLIQTKSYVNVFSSYFLS
jgi:hypothetical protein